MNTTLKYTHGRAHTAGKEMEEGKGESLSQAGTETSQWTTDTGAKCRFSFVGFS
jgi:hypothetical protein